MKLLLTVLTTLLLTACSPSPTEPELDAPAGYDEANYFYWPNQADDYQILYEVVAEASDGFSYQYPIIANLVAEHPLSQALEVYQTEAEKWAQDQQAFYAETQAETAADPGFDLSDPLPWNYSVGWLGGRYHPQLWSLAFQVYTYAGGAHPNHWTDTYNYAPATNQIVQLADLFNTDEAFWTTLDTTVMNEVIQTKRQHWNDDAAEYDPAQDFFLEDLTFDQESLSRWVTAERDGQAGILFFFPPYDIGAYAEGGYEVFIPASVFEPWLKEEFKSVFD